MAASPAASDAPPALAQGGHGRARPDELAMLYEIIHAVTSTLELDRVLAAIVRLVNETIEAHATYVFLAEEGRLVLRAASPRYAHLCGQVSMAAGEGIAGWVLENRQPVFIPENVLADPRIKYFPELEEEKYQSLVSVPLTVKGEHVIGVIALHAEAPRVFSSQDAAFLLHVASLVGHAVHNARLYEETLRSLRELEQLSRLGGVIARADSVGELLRAAVEHARELLRAESVRIYLVEVGGERLRVRASAPEQAEGPELVTLPQLDLRLGGRGFGRGAGGAPSATSVLAGALWGVPAMSSALVAPLVAGDDVLGFLVAQLGEGRRAREQHRDLATSVATQTALGLKRLQLADRLAERNLIKDLFDDLASGGGGTALIGRARRVGLDPDAPHVVVWAATEPPANPRDAPERVFDAAAEAFELALSRLAPGCVVDRRDDVLRALVPVPDGAAGAFGDRLEQVVAANQPPLAVGLSSSCAEVRAAPVGFGEARQAVLAVPVVRPPSLLLRYEDLGLYKYLLRLPREEWARDRRVDAMRRLRDHDRRRQSQLLHTVEEFLRQHGSVAATAKALYVHPNTLRQRLRRISEIAGLDPRQDDWLMLEIASKLLKLEEVYPAGARPPAPLPGTPSPKGD